MDPERDVAWAALRGAAHDRRSGAAEIALRGAEALAALHRSDLEEAVRALVTGHPSMAALWRLGTEVLAAEDHRDAAAAFAREMLAERHHVAELAAPALRAPRLVLHSYSSTLVATVRNTGSVALCARSEPGGEGEDTARVLQEEGVDARVIDDFAAVGAAAAGIPVVTGADAVGPAGVVNKVGTRGLARAARSGGGACTILAGTSKLLAVDLPVTDPFERTPLDLVGRVVTDAGILTPSDVVAATGRFPLHPRLARVLAEL